jgi:hypothetical protein
MPQAAAMKLTLKHGRGKVHELECRWLNGPRMDPEWVRNAYHVVPASEVRGRPPRQGEGPRGAGLLAFRGNVGLL